MAGARLSAVLLREARRQARRWETYVLRLATASTYAFLVILVIGVFVLGNDGQMDVARWSQVGRILVFGSLVFLLVVVGLLSPLLVALGIIEERDEGTLDLIVLTRLSATQLLLGKLGSRLLTVFAIVAAVLPIVASLIGFGGVSPWQLVNGLAGAALVGLWLGVIGGFLTIEARSVVLPYLLAGICAFAVFGTIPLVYEDHGLGAIVPCTASGTGCGNVDRLAELSPLFALAVSTPFGLLPWLVHLPTLLCLLALAPSAFRVATGGAGFDKHVSWDARLIQAFGVLTWVFAIATGIAGWFVHVGPAASPAPVWAWYAVGSTASTLLFVRLAMALIARASGRAGTVWSVMPSLGVSRWRFRLVPRPLRNPVAWRELFTRGQRGANAAGAVVTLSCLLFTGLVAADSGVEDVGDLVWFFALTAGSLTALVVATASATDERADGRLELLLLTTIPRYRIVVGKLLPAVAHGSVLLFVALLWEATYRSSGPVQWAEVALFKWGLAEAWGATNSSAVVLYGVPWARLPVAFAWGTAWLVAVALPALATGLYLRQGRLAWVLNLVGWALVPWSILFATLVVAIALDKLWPAIDHQWVFEFAVPYYGRDWTSDGAFGIPVTMIASTAVLAGAASIEFVLVVLGLRRYGARWFDTPS